VNLAHIRVDLVDCMGTDLSVVNAARVSMAKESVWDLEQVGFFKVTKLSDADVKLIGYLAKNKHWTPFSHPQITFRIKAPIFVARQWFKHMIGITRNEESRRYIDSEPEFFIPDTVRTRPAVSIKQGSGGAHPECETWREVLIEATGTALATYQIMVADGVAPEQARMILPQNTMTEWVETASLAAICRACGLRLDGHAQQETRMVAEQVAEIVARKFPVSWSALMELNNG